MSDVPPIIFCPVCQVDTLPLRTGLCAWCETRLVPLARAEAHGTEAEYRHGCRCEPCRAAASVARRARRRAVKPPAWLVRREARLAASEAETR